MVFPSAASGDATWDRIAEATHGGRLGVGAKAATARSDPEDRGPHRSAIMVYTRDWQDKEDVRRVLVALRRLGITQRLSYKTDSATMEGIYGTGAAIYVSQPGASDFEDRSGGSRPP